MTQKNTPANESSPFVCPMHPEVTSDRPGHCHKCGMELVRKNVLKKEATPHHGGHDNGDPMAHHRMMADAFRKRFLLTLPLTVLLLLLSPQVQSLLNFDLYLPAGNLILALFGSIIVLYGGFPFFQAAKEEIKTRNWGMMTLVSLAISAGYLFSLASTFLFAGEILWWEISTLVSVFLFGHWLEMRAVIGTSGALKELAKLIPPSAHRLRDKTNRQETEDVPTENLQINDLVLVRPGEKIPIDGIVISGNSFANEAMITGESQPVAKKEGDRVIGGSLNFDGSLIIKVEKTGSSTALAQIMRLVSEAQMTRPKVQDLADRAARFLTLTAILVSSGTFIYWALINPTGIIFAATLSITVIVIACPHALGLAIPTVTTIATTLAAKNGILIRDMKGIEAVKNLDYLVFDKTGTLTTGEFGVTKVVPLANVNPGEILRLAAAVEYHSQHSLAAAIVGEARRQKLKFKPAVKFVSIPGVGAEGIVGNEKVVLGNKKVLVQNGLKSKRGGVSELDNLAQTIVWVGKGKEIIGAILLGDRVRNEAKETVAKLRQMGIQVVMLTGDRQEVATEVGQRLGIDTVIAEVLPQDKVERIRDLQKNGQVVGMVGDGVNDAPSLTQANVGIAIGAGTAVAIESAQVVLQKNNLLGVLKTIALSRKVDTKMKQNLAWAAGYNVLAIPAAAGAFRPLGVILRPEWGAVLMSLSSMIVVVNALLLRKTKLEGSFGGGEAA